MHHNITVISNSKHCNNSNIKHAKNKIAVYSKLADGFTHIVWTLRFSECMHTCLMQPEMT